MAVKSYPKKVAQKNEVAPLAMQCLEFIVSSHSDLVFIPEKGRCFQVIIIEDSLAPCITNEVTSLTSLGGSPGRSPRSRSGQGDLTSKIRSLRKYSFKKTATGYTFFPFQKRINNTHKRWC